MTVSGATETGGSCPRLVSFKELTLISTSNAGFDWQSTEVSHTVSSRLTGLTYCLLLADWGPTYCLFSRLTEVSHTISPLGWLRSHLLSLPLAGWGLTYCLLSDDWATVVVIISALSYFVQENRKYRRISMTKIKTLKPNRIWEL